MSERHSRSEQAGPKAPTLSDSQLFEGMAEGDLGPLGELFDRYHVSVQAFAERMLGSRADAADLVQETFLAASRAAGSFEPGAAAKPFLLGVAAQLVRRRRRSFARLRAMLESFSHAPTTPRATPEEQLNASEESALLDSAVARLSEDHREVLLLVDLGGLTGVEVAKALGIPAGTVWRRLHEARSALITSVKRRVR